MLENKIIFDSSDETKIEKNLINKFKNYQNGKEDNICNKTTKLLSNAKDNFTEDLKQGIVNVKSPSSSNLKNWISRQCLINGINFLNNSITIPSIL